MGMVGKCDMEKSKFDWLFLFDIVPYRFTGLHCLILKQQANIHFVHIWTKHTFTVPY